MQNIHIKSSEALIPFEEKSTVQSMHFKKFCTVEDSRLNILISYACFILDLNYLLKIYDTKFAYKKI